MLSTSRAISPVPSPGHQACFRVKYPRTAVKSRQADPGNPKEIAIWRSCTETSACMGTAWLGALPRRRCSLKPDCLCQPESKTLIVPLPNRVALVRWANRAHVNRQPHRRVTLSGTGMVTTSSTGRGICAWKLETSALKSGLRRLNLMTRRKETRWEKIHNFDACPIHSKTSSQVVFDVAKGFLLWLEDVFWAVRDPVNPWPSAPTTRSLVLPLGPSAWVRSLFWGVSIAKLESRRRCEDEKDKAKHSSLKIGDKTQRGTYKGAIGPLDRCVTIPPLHTILLPYLCHHVPWPYHVSLQDSLKR